MIKNCLKLLKDILKNSNKNIPILSHVQVLNHKLFATNIDYGIVIQPVEINNGIYELNQIERWIDSGIKPEPAAHSMDDFPEEIKVKGNHKIDHFNLHEFKELFDYLPKISQYKYNITGICFDDKNCVALDGKAMLYKKHNYNFPEAILLPAILGKHTKIFSDCSLFLDESRFAMKRSNFTFYGNLLKGKYPNYGLFIPNTTKYSFEIESKYLKQIIKNVKPDLAKDSIAIIFKIENNKLYATVDNSEVKAKVFETPIIKSDNDVEFSHSIDNLSRLLKYDKLIFRYNTPLSQFVINKNIIIMPCKKEISINTNESIKLT